MKRDLKILKDQQFDAVVIGGGIHGATIYHQLAKSGLRVALIEKGDFGQATSANSLKILHGGLRYLQHLNINRMRESIKSRWHFMEIASHLIKPMPCIMATKGLGIQGRPVMAIALALFDLIAWDRNKNTPEKNKVGRGKVISKKECLKIAPGINTQELTGAALWYDDLIMNTERMILAFIKQGSDTFHGVAANYLKADELIKDGEKIVGVRVDDQLSDDTFFIKTKNVINAAGPWAGDITSPGRATSAPEDLAKAVNIVVNKSLFNGYGIGLAGASDFVDKDAVIKRGKRLFFFAPWKKNTIIGTTYRYYRQENDALTVTPEDIDELLQEVNSIYPVARLTRENVTFAHAGLVPAHKGINFDHTTTPQLVKHSRIIDHQQYDNISGLFTIEGVKYTTAPEIARQLVELFKKKGIATSGFPTLHTAPYSRRKVSLSQASIDRMDETYPHIQENYGNESGSVYQIMEEIEDASTLLLEEPVLTKAEVIYAVEEEMAIKLLDVILRRTEAATSACPSAEKLKDIAEVMATQCTWDETEIEQQVQSVLDYYSTVLNIHQ